MTSPCLKSDFAALLLICGRVSDAGTFWSYVHHVETNHILIKTYLRKCFTPKEMQQLNLQYLWTRFKKKSAEVIPYAVLQIVWYTIQLYKHKSFFVLSEDRWFCVEVQEMCVLPLKAVLVWYIVVAGYVIVFNGQIVFVFDGLATLSKVYLKVMFVVYKSRNVFLYRFSTGFSVE